MTDGNNGLGETGSASGRKIKSPAEMLKPRDVPPPPKRSKGAKGNMVVVMNFMMTCLVLATIALCAAAYFEPVFSE
ncbi:MAG: 4-amino-4-deoxychorismate lyase, partial [Pseudomonadota bacterium]